MILHTEAFRLSDGLAEVVCLLQLGLALDVAGLRDPATEHLPETLPADVLFEVIAIKHFKQTN